jgi:uncharacterized phosphosugar-binding protein
MIQVEVTARLLDKGITPPVLVSANTDEGDQKNKQMIELYRSKVSYL